MSAPSSPPAWPMAGVGLLLALVLGGSLAFAVVNGELPVGRAGAAFVFGGTMLFFLGSFAGVMRTGAWPTVETNWGGLGGGLGGWRVSPAVLYFLGTLVFGSLLAALCLPVSQAPLEASASTP